MNTHPVKGGATAETRACTSYTGKVRVRPGRARGRSSYRHAKSRMREVPVGRRLRLRVSASARLGQPWLEELLLTLRVCSPGAIVAVGEATARRRVSGSAGGPGPRPRARTCRAVECPTGPLTGKSRPAVRAWSMTFSSSVEAPCQCRPKGTTFHSPLTGPAATGSRSGTPRANMKWPAPLSGESESKHSESRRRQPAGRADVRVAANASY